MSKKLQKGFTLIELLVVIAVLGVLAAAVLVAVNPLEQFARGRDAGRKTSIGQLGRAMQDVFTSTYSYPPTGNAWIVQLLTTGTYGELKLQPVNPTNASYTGCTAAGKSDNAYCYDINAGSTDAVIWAPAESKSEIQKAGACAAPSVVYIMWSSAEGKTGLGCAPATGPVPGTVYGLK